MTTFPTPTTAPGIRPAAPLEPFIGKPEVARRLRKDVRTIDNWMKRGLIPYYKVARSVSFRWSEIEASLRTRYWMNGSRLKDN